MSCVYFVGFQLSTMVHPKNHVVLVVGPVGTYWHRLVRGLVDGNQGAGGVEPDTSDGLGVDLGMSHCSLNAVANCLPDLGGILSDVVGLDLFAHDGTFGQAKDVTTGVDHHGPGRPCTDVHPDKMVGLRLRLRRRLLLCLFLQMGRHSALMRCTKEEEESNRQKIVLSLYKSSVLRGSEFRCLLRCPHHVL